MNWNKEQDADEIYNIMPPMAPLDEKLQQIGVAEK